MISRLHNYSLVIVMVGCLLTTISPEILPYVRWMVESET